MDLVRLENSPPECILQQWPKIECTGERHTRLTEKLGNGRPLWVKIKGDTKWKSAPDYNITISVVLIGFGDGRGQMVALNHQR